MRQALCMRCLMPALVNTMTLRGRIIGEYCGACFDLIEHDEPNRNRTQKTSGIDNNDPSLDDAVRALEEDR